MNRFFRCSIVLSGWLLLPGAPASAPASAQEGPAAPRPAEGAVQVPGSSQDAGAEKVRPSRAATDVVARAREELLDIQQKLRGIENRTLAARAGLESRLEELAQEKSSSDRLLQTLKAEVERQEKDVAEKTKQAADGEKEIARLKADLKALVDPIRQALDRLESHIEGGIPWKVSERKAGVQKLREQLGRPAADLARVLAGVRRLQEDEEANGRLVEPGVVEVEIKGEKRAIPAIRWGLIGLMFTNPDETLSGFVIRGQTVEDALAAPADASRPARKGYTTALEILQGRLSPRLVDLFIPTLPKAAEEVR